MQVTIGQLRLIAETEAKAQGLDPAIVAALITVESSWDPLSMRYEPGYRYVLEIENFAKLTKTPKATEGELQRISFGLMQVMGATARSCGYRGKLWQLLDPEVNVRWGCHYLAGHARKYPGVVDSQIAAYNAGSVRYDLAGLYFNQAYVDKVKAAMT